MKQLAVMLLSRQFAIAAHNAVASAILKYRILKFLGASMATSRPVDITAAPRAVISFASGLVTRVVAIPTAQENAWSAVCADRKRAAARAELAAVLRSTVKDF